MRNVSFDTAEESLERPVEPLESHLCGLGIEVAYFNIHGTQHGEIFFLCRQGDGLPSTLPGSASLLQGRIVQGLMPALDPQ